MPGQQMHQPEMANQQPREINMVASSMNNNEEDIANNFPLQALSSNQEGQRQLFIDEDVQMVDQQMSPGANG